MKNRSLKVSFPDGEVKHLCGEHCLDEKIDGSVALQLMENPSFQTAFGMRAEFSESPCDRCREDFQ